MKMIEHIGLSISCLDDEDMVDKAYSGLVSLIEMVSLDKKTNSAIVLVNNGLRERDINVFLPLTEGIYIPGSARNYWCGFLDPVDMPPPIEGCVYMQPRYRNIDYEFIVIRQIKRFPKGVICGSCKNPKFIYKTYNVFFIKNIAENFMVEEGYFAIDHEGYLHNTVDRLKLRNHLTGNVCESLREDYQNAAYFGAGAISLLADRRYIWNIKTSEDVGIGKGQAIVNFGVEEEMVKSLVYARDNPLTESGRKRPILHWVKMHKRRIKNGIEIDVRKHLRGITDFQMGELAFQITKPKKNLGQNNEI